MPMKLSNMLSGAPDENSVVSTMENYLRRYGSEEWSGTDERKADHLNFVRVYYDLVTDFYNYGWGSSFHFASRSPGESFPASLARHEHYLAHKLGLGPGMVAADLGCGIGGPLREMVRFSGARIVGINNNAYQLEQARQQTDEAGLSRYVDYVECDFANVDAPDGSFDAVFAIETTCCTPDKVGVFGEAFRLLKPGGRFGTYEYCLTDRFVAEDPEHRRIKVDMEVGGGLPGIARPHEIDNAMEEVGFELLEARDLTENSLFEIPWYDPLVGSGLSVARFRGSSLGRRVTHASLWALEKVRVVPRGTLLVSSLMNRAATAFVEAGRLRIFTPMYFALGEKPN